MPFSDTTPVLEFEPGEQFRVVEPFTYTTQSGVDIIVPAGFETDLASIPRIFWNILPPGGNYAPAAIVHDLLYRYPGHVVGGRKWTRAEADGVLLEAMTELGDVSWLTRWTIYLAVRVGAWWAWA